MTKTYDASADLSHSADTGICFGRPTPVILAAYDAVASSPQVANSPRSTLSCREVYLTEPDTVTDQDLICDIAYPLGSRTFRRDSRDRSGGQAIATGVVA